MKYTKLKKIMDVSSFLAKTFDARIDIYMHLKKYGITNFPYNLTTLPKDLVDEILCELFID